jgi:3-oxoacyl-[acyl-carrier-protein] synthase II
MRRVVVTSMGAVTPCGLDVESTWESVLQGRSGIGRITLFDPSAHASQIAGECTGFDAERFIRKRDLRSMDRFIHLTMAAAEELMKGSGLDEYDPLKLKTGTFIGAGIGGISTIESLARVLAEKGPDRISPYFIPAPFSNLAPGQVSMKYGLRGTSYCTTSACASGAHSIGEAFRAIARGDLEACVAGGAEAAVTPLGVGGFAAMRALSKRNGEPTRASRPWDVDRDGFVIAEGAGLLLLEEREHALARGARVLAESVGSGASADAHHPPPPSPEGEGAGRAISAALRDARIDASQVDYVNAHGTSTPVGDVLELRAARKVFGAHATNGLSISSTKGVTGHLLGAAGGVEAVLSVCALRDGAVPPTVNLERVEPELEDFDLVAREARDKALRYVVSNSFGFGGTNATLVFARV